MNRLTRRGMRLTILTGVFAGLFVAVNAVPGAATTPVFKGTELGRGTYLGHGSLPIPKGKQIVVFRNDVDEGAMSGWHSHPGGAIVVVATGQITTYRSVGNDQGEKGDGNTGNTHCVTTIYHAGDAFIERPGEPLNAVNPGPGGTIIYATFPGVPGGSPKTPEANPGTCPF